MRKLVIIFLIVIYGNYKFVYGQVNTDANNIVNQNMDNGWAALKGSNNLLINISSYSLLPAKFLEDTLHKYKFRQQTIGFTYPFFTQQTSKLKHIFSISLNSGYSVPSTLIFQQFHNVYNFGSNLNYSLVKQNNFILFGSIGLGVAEDQYTLKDYILRYNGYFNYLRTVNNNFKWQLGWVTQYGYKSYITKPVAAIHFTAWKGSTVTLGIPFNFSVRHSFNDAFDFILSSRSVGNSFRIYALNEPLLNSTTASIQMRQQQIFNTLGFNYKLSSRFNFRIDAGIATNRHFNFGERESRLKANFKNFGIENGPLIQVSVNYQLPLSKNSSLNKNAIINYIDINDIDVSDVIDNN
jgi:hypothetical protein